MPLEDQSKIVPLSPAEFAAAQADLTDLTTKLLPLLRHFTPEYIKRLTKYGEKSDAFVQQADAALTNIQGIPQFGNAFRVFGNRTPKVGNSIAKFGD